MIIILKKKVQNNGKKYLMINVTKTYLPNKEKYLKATWIMPTREWVNPLQDIKAIREEIDLGITSRTRAAAGKGRNFEDIIDEQVKEEQMINEKRKKAGLVVDAVDANTK